MRSLHRTLLWSFIACVSLLPACATSVEHGRVLESDVNDPFVTVEAGNVQFRGGRFFARYAVDRATQTCWLIVGTALSEMDCCATRRVAQLRAVIHWQSDATCATAGGYEAASPPPPISAAPSGGR